MKKSILLFYLSVLLCQFTQAQIRKIPAAVTEAFEKNYPNAKHVEWRDRLSHFTASFQNEGKSMVAQFESDGTWIKSETIIPIAEIPTEVKDGFDKSKYRTWTIGEIALIQQPEETEMYYRILVRKNSINKKYLHFNPKGQLSKETPTL